MKVLSLFSGIGAFEKALDNLQVPYELVAYCEIDKYASKSYAAIHGVPESLNLGDITKVDEKLLPKDIDLITYGFPCQDISLAGKQKGLFNEDGTQTRSGLFFEALRIIEETQPRVAIAENVKNLTGKKFASQFQIVLESLEKAGYNNYWKVLNLKDYGIPQNRERVFIVSIRKDIDNGTFKFPTGFPLKLRLKDVLEDQVDEKYYLSRKMIDYVTADVEGCGFGGDIDPEIARTITATMTKMHRAGIDNYVSDAMVRQIGNCCPTKTRDNPNQGRIYDTEGISPALNCMGGGNRQPFVVETK
jgi:DNA (cytosine-5)-methyltransferase 1